MKLITETLLNTVSGQAKENPRLRMNYNFHESMDAPIHRMLNALEPDTYLPPHRHKNPDKEEIYLVLRGSLLAILFDEEGNVTIAVRLNSTTIKIVCSTADFPRSSIFFSFPSPPNQKVMDLEVTPRRISTPFPSPFQDY